MHLVKVLSLAVVRLQVLIADRPSRRNTVMVTDLTEVLLTQADQRCAVEFSVATDVIVRTGVKLLTVLVKPRFLDVVAGLDVDRVRVPVFLLTRDIRTAFEQQDPFARRRQFVGQRPAARAGTNDDDIVVIRLRHRTSNLGIRCWELVASRSEVLNCRYQPLAPNPQPPS